MNAKRAVLALCTTLICTASTFTNAKLISEAEISFTDLRITSDVSASFMWLNSWLGFAQADAADSFGSSASVGDDETGNDFLLSEQAITPYVETGSIVSVTGGETLGFGAGLFA